MSSTTQQSEELAHAAGITIEGVSDMHDVAVTPCKGPGLSAFVGQPLFRMGPKLYGGTLCACRHFSGDPEKTDEMAAHVAALHNINAARLRGEL